VHLQKQSVPPLSIAAGIDFGWYKWIKRLVMPNLQEQIILSCCQLFLATMKILLNCVGHVDYTWEALKCHAVLFADDTIDDVVEDFKKGDMFNINQLNETMEINLLDSGGYFDQLAEEAYGWHDLLACSWVVYQ
jgi:hypothetical protein